MPPLCHRQRTQGSGLPLSFWSGGRTKFNRTQQGYPKAHWIDAAVSVNRDSCPLDLSMTVLQVKATGHGSRQMCRMDRFGFPRTSAKAARVVNVLELGICEAIVPSASKLVRTLEGGSPDFWQF